MVVAGKTLGFLFAHSAKGNQVVEAVRANGAATKRPARSQSEFQLSQRPKGNPMNRKMSIVPGAAVLLGLLGNVTNAEPPKSINNRQGIVAFAEARKGQTVGGGQCTDLVNAALKSVGARQLVKEPSPWWWNDKRFPAQGPKERYVWGAKVIGSVKGHRGVPVMNAGAIVQFENF